MMLCTVACLLAVNAVSGIAGDNCTLCHQVTTQGYPCGIASAPPAMEIR